jgi:excisionase family DNA binding protein
MCTHYRVHIFRERGMADRKTIDVPEAAQQLGLSRNAAYEAVRRGEIPAVRIGRRLFVPRDAIDRLLAEASLKSTGV